MAKYKNLKLPLKYINGCIADTDGNILAYMLRISEETPLWPTERDALAQDLVDAFNIIYQLKNFSI